MNFDIVVKQNSFFSTLLTIVLFILIIIAVLYFVIDDVKDYIDNLIELIFIRVSRPSRQQTNSGQSESGKSIPSNKSSVVPGYMNNLMTNIMFNVPPKTLILEKSKLKVNSNIKLEDVEDLSIDNILLYNDINKLITGLSIPKKFIKTQGIDYTIIDEQGNPKLVRDVTYKIEIDISTLTKDVKIKRIEIYPCSTTEIEACFKCSINNCGINELSYPKSYQDYQDCKNKECPNDAIPCSKCDQSAKYPIDYLSYDDCVNSFCNILTNSPCKCKSNLLDFKVKLVGIVNTNTQELQTFNINRMDDVYEIVVL